MTSNIVIQFMEPEILSMNVKKSSIDLKLDFAHNGKANVTITKLRNGYQYEDKGFFTRQFEELDAMMWEYELPKILKGQIKRLKVSN